LTSERFLSNPYVCVLLLLWLRGAGAYLREGDPGFL
jgi:hypothetical protein